MRDIVRRGELRNYHQLEALMALYTLLQPTAPLPQMRRYALSPDAGWVLVDEILQGEPKIVVECGSGASTILIGLALRQVGSDGRVIALEHDPTFAARTREEVERLGLGEVAEVAHAPLSPQWLRGRSFEWYDPRAVEGIESIDLILVDGPPRSTGELARYPALPMLADKWALDGTLLLDDADREDETRIRELWEADCGPLAMDHVRSEKGLLVVRRR
ncbi:class I SAM-dependent methyltransferase [Egibacter rhizosphaerae]|uniref:class I SAM-dependent methyltransferase n=1 Tax=Egibacter rhizosphaerae TaxID=1670831 RepID=UPI0013F15B5E|nr:class I SAM-dependent methyltransferase [Egibacter rhizosphaerae]